MTRLDGIMRAAASDDLKLSGDVAMRQRVLKDWRIAVPDEERFLADEIYGGQPKHDRTRIDLRNRFSERG